METDRLRYFVTIVECGSMTKASEILNISHSGLSKAISVLQDELGFRVFTPQGRGLEVTEQGKVLYNKGQEILKLVGQLQVEDLPRVEPSLRLALPEPLALGCAGSFAKEFDIAIEEADSGELESKLLSGRVEFGFSFVPFPHPELDYLKISKVEITSLRREDSFKGKALNEVPYVVPSSEMRDNPLSLRYRDGWITRNRRHIAFKASSLALALEMLMAGKCVLYAPKFLIAHYNRNLQPGVRIALAGTEAERKATNTKRDVFLVKKKSQPENKTMKRTVRILKEALKSCHGYCKPLGPNPHM